MVKFRVSVYANKVLYRIVENFKKLQCLDIIFESGVFDEELIVLADLEHLTHFSISCNNKTAVANLLNALIVKNNCSISMCAIESL
uniref:Uncharacterized protein n=1 Tax=Ditylenchus dipsaci TaxID=166011 RepID=A0A915EPY9_9BILA